MKMATVFIPIILGTARPNRQSEKAARFMLGEAKKLEGVETALLDVRDFRLPATDNSGTSDAAKRLAEHAKRADGFVIVSPEYNHGYPGELKMMLDTLYREYARKPVGICGVSAGPTGGARMVEQLRLVVIEFHMAPIREAVYFSNISRLFDANGSLVDEAYFERAKVFFDELLWYAKALKVAREKK